MTLLSAAELVAENHPARFWKPILDPSPTERDWEEAALAAAPLLPAAAQGHSIREILGLVLTEGQFGTDHFEFGRALRMYYRLKPVLPRRLIRRLRRARATGAVTSSGLNWPIEDRYAAFLRGTLMHLMRARGIDRLPYLHLWPNAARAAVVLTHDVETAGGLERVPLVAELERRLGFRSAFNFVPERYRVPEELRRRLLQQGFEVGVHDLNHDGRLFDSETRFGKRAERINGYVKQWRAGGFRSALTHRNPAWMQRLDVDYDESFFDVDPHEPIPGGTMSLWPFLMGRHLELPYTMIQDYTLTVLGERSPDIWLNKASYLIANGAMVLLNSHPDYLGISVPLSFYERLLQWLADQEDCWRALPREVARWWRRRHNATSVEALPGGVLALAELRGDGLAFTIDAPGVTPRP